MQTNDEFRIDLVDIGLESIAVAAARVCGYLPVVIKVCLKTSMFIILMRNSLCCVNAEARNENPLPPALNAPEPHRASSVWGTYKYIY